MLTSGCWWLSCRLLLLLMLVINDAILVEQVCGKVAYGAIGSADGDVVIAWYKCRCW